VTVVEPEEAAPSSPSVLTVGEFFSMRVLDVFFDFDKYDLHDDSVATLDRNAVSLKERPEIFFLIEGHCDERGSEAYNLALGDKRAQAARQYLISKGISADRIDTISYGEERPFASGQTESAWGQNRRAHFVLRKPSATISDGLSGSWIQR
jgi:peptidoglycan-associated lipoprotein